MAKAIKPGTVMDAIEAFDKELECWQIAPGHDHCTIRHHPPLPPLASKMSKSYKFEELHVKDRAEAEGLIRYRCMLAALEAVKYKVQK